MARQMTAKQKRFVQEYLIDLNARQAAVRAGYGERLAGQTGSRLLRNNPLVAAAIEAAQAERAERTGVTADRVLIELAKVAFGDPRRLLTVGAKGIEVRDPAELTDAEAALISDITQIKSAAGGNLRVKLHCKMTALNALAKHLGLFNGRLKQPERNEDAGAEDDDPRERLARKIARISARLRAGENPDTVDEG
jgi:phage terminase small subunit